MKGALTKELFSLEDEDNPSGSGRNTIYPPTTLDQVFDNLDPMQTTLREILSKLKNDILTGGIGDIKFPVTSVNHLKGDVVLNANSVGLGRVDNTRDIDKPLSVPQKNSILDILKNYDFNVNLDDLYNHIRDTNNPHKVTLNQLNRDGEVSDLIKRMIAQHNQSTDLNVHMDIRRSLSKLWNLTDGINRDIDTRLNQVVSGYTDHMEDNFAHEKLFQEKESISQKVKSFNQTVNNDYEHYPSTRSVVDYMNERLKTYDQTLPDIKDWIDDIGVVDHERDLPPLNSRFHRKAYFIRHGKDSHTEFAICKQNPDGNYSWDLFSLGSYSKFDSTYFKDSTDGITIQMDQIVQAILSENGMLDTSLAEVLQDYYKKDEIDVRHYITDLKILPGTLNGTIRYYINDDLTTMSDDIKVPGFGQLAYKDYITENELYDQSVQERHILPQSIRKEHIQPKSITTGMLCCEYGKLLGNTEDPDGDDVNGIALYQLADWLRPLIGGWPDPNTPGGNPWSDMVNDRINSTQLWEPNMEHDYGDYSYGLRFKGTISSLPNLNVKTRLTTNITVKDHRLMDAGGSWCYQSSPEEWTILGGSNITGHTFATVNLCEDGLYLETISIGDRYEAEYDIWVKYTKKSEQIYLWNPEPEVTE